MEKQFESETKSTPESTEPADEVLSDKELDEVSGGDDEAPKETIFRTSAPGGFI